MPVMQLSCPHCGTQVCQIEYADNDNVTVNVTKTAGGTAAAGAWEKEGTERDEAAGVIRASNGRRYCPCGNEIRDSQYTRCWECAKRDMEECPTCDGWKSRNYSQCRRCKDAGRRLPNDHSRHEPPPRETAAAFAASDDHDGFESGFFQ